MFLSLRHIELYTTLHTYRCVKLPLDLDLRSSFEVDLPRISPASGSVSPFKMWFDTCLLLQKHPQVAVERFIQFG